MTVVSRLELNHPALGTAGGSSLHTQIEDIYKKIGDNMADRFFLIAALGNGASIDLDHNFNVAIENLRYDLYLATIATKELGTKITKISTPPITDFVISPKVGFEKTQLTITNNSGSPRDLAVCIFNDPIELGELTDIDFSTPPEEGQALVYEAGKFKPGASGDASFKLQSISSDGTALVFKAGTIRLNDGKVLYAANDLTDDVSGKATSDGDWSVFIDLDSLGSSSIVNSRRVYAITTSNFAYFKAYIDDPTIDRVRYIPCGGFDRTSGVYSSVSTSPFRPYDIPSYTNGVKNYIKNPSGAFNIPGMLSTDPNMTITVDRSSSIPRFNTSGCAYKLVSSIDEAIAPFRFTLDKADLNKKMGFSFAQSVAIANQYRVEVYSNSSSDYSGSYVRLPLSSDVSGDSYCPIGDGTFEAAVDVYTVPYIEVRFIHNGTNNTPAYFSDVKFSGDAVKQGAVVTDEIDFTPGSFVNSPPATTMNLTYAKYQRSGSKLKARIRWDIASGSFNYTSNTNAIKVDRLIPSGLTVEPSSIAGSRNGFGLVHFYCNNSDTYVVHGYSHGFIEYDGTNYRFFVNTKPTTPSSASVTDLSWNLFGNATGDTAQFIELEFEVGIVEWKGAGTLNIADVQNKGKHTKDVPLTITLSNAGWNVLLGQGYAKCDSNGVYRLHIDVVGKNSTGFSAGFGSFTIGGIKALASVDQQFTAFTDSLPDGVGVALISKNTNNVSWYCTGADNGEYVQTAEIRVSGEIILQEKPTWFDANVETNDWQPVGFGFATVTSYGLSLLNKIQRKTISSAASGIGLNLAVFNNLTIGKLYRIDWQVTVTEYNNTLPHYIDVRRSTNVVYSGSNVLLSNGGGSAKISQCGSHITFVADDATARVYYYGGSGVENITGGIATITEMNTGAVTTDFI